MHPSNSVLVRLRLQTIALLALAVATAPVSQAIVFEWSGLKGSFDTTVSFGVLGRTEDPDPALFGLASGGQQRSVNADDGNLNYRNDLVSTLIKANHDLLVEFGRAGFFARGFYFRDFTNTNGQRSKIALSDEARSLVGSGGDLLDAYLYLKPEIAGRPASLRLGQQVLSWGESTFIPNGINSINPVDVSKLRTPGSELKEALLPLKMVSGSLSVSENLTLEGFYLFDWDRTRIDPPGTFFSTNDFVAKGGTRVYLGFGAIADTATLGAINRGPDGEPGESGQWGVNLRWLAPGLNDTEFGLYYMNYHSRLPAISARTPSTPINTALIGSDTGAILQANPAFLASLVPAAGAAGVPVPTALSLLIGASLGAVPASSVPAALLPLLPTVAGVSGQVAQREFLVSAATGQYLIEFPEDIHLFGASFNTSIKGIALQGELSYRNNQPLQIDDVELLFAALGSINASFAGNNQIGSFLGQLSTRIPGWRSHKVWTGQLTATKVARGFFGASQTTLLAEAGFVQADLPPKSVLRYDGPGTFRGGNLAAMIATGNAAVGADPADSFADEFSWGYQLVGRLDYNNFFAGANFSPLVVFGHDVDGNSPAPVANFRKERKTLTLGADFTYQNAWAFELRYVNFFGAGRFNLLGDRDYVSATIRYSF